MVSTPTVHDKSALLVESTLPDKIAADVENPASESKSPDVIVDAVDRIDIDEPRIDTAVNDEIVAKDAADELTEDTAHVILNRYGFGAGMRMYARSLALAELEEKERVKAADAKAAAELETKKAAEALKAVKGEKVTITSPKKTACEVSEPKSSIVIPSAKSVIDFETVRSELSKAVQSIASLGSMEYFSQSKSTKEVTRDVASANDDDDGVIEVISDTSGDADVRRASKGGCCGADEALEEIFRDAEVWAEATYKNMSTSVSENDSTTTRSSKKPWWSFLFPSKKDSIEVKESLHLDEITDKTVPTVGTNTNWWSVILCAPVIVEEYTDKIPKGSVDLVAQ